MNFAFSTVGRIVFGAGELRCIPAEVRSRGKRVLVLTGANIERTAGLREALKGCGVAVTLFQVAHEPTTSLVLEGVELARQAHCDCLLAVGGGSVLDAGKAIAALVTNAGELMDYLEVIGRARPLTCAPMPLIAVPTTAGTGAEVTRNAVLFSPEHGLKVSLRSDLLLPWLAVVDPEMGRSLPPGVTMATGLDALTQLLEAFVSRRANPLTDGLCREGLARVGDCLPRACERGDDLQAREGMALASLLSGMALANAGLGAVHGLAAPLGGITAAPHGMLCACMLPYVMEANVLALRRSDPNHPVLDRYGEAARLITGHADATCDNAAAWVRRLSSQYGTPSLAGLGLQPLQIPDLVLKAQGASSMRGNPIELSDRELEGILKSAL